VNRQQALQQGPQLIKWHHIRPVAGRLIGLRVYLQEDAVHAGSYRRSGQGADELALTAGSTVRTARQLYAVGGVKDDYPQPGCCNRSWCLAR